ncbi:MAG: Mur ligase family protein [bacterium]
MNRTFTHTLQTLTDLAKDRGIHYNLDHMQQALALLGNPEKHLAPVIHIAGTNGKGSTLRFISEGLMHLGVKVATFSSPHLHCYSERIAINKQAIPASKFVRIFNNIQEVIPTSLGLCEFEYLTCMALIYFLEQAPDYILLETGLGGRLDATNVCQPCLTIITSISMDHQDILGETLQEIAAEKAGIIKKGVPVIIPTQQDSLARQVIQNVATGHKSQVIQADAYPLAEQPRYQAENIGIAKKAITHLYPLSEEKNDEIDQCLNRTQHPGRFEIQGYNDKTLVFDGAHNKDAIAALGRSLQAFTAQKESQVDKIGIILAIQKHKDAIGMLKQLRKFPFTCYYVADLDDRFFSFTDIQKVAASQTLRPFYWQTKEMCKEDICVFTGSLYWIAEARMRYTSR